MAKKQTRRSISVKGTTYQRLKNWCEKNGKSISGHLEVLIKDDMDDRGEPVPEKVDPPKARSVNVDEVASQHFTF